jgi:hypothetical protein
MQAVGKPHYDNVAYMHQRLDKYTETGNLECLVDVANLAQLEFVESRHPLKHFRSAHDVDHVEEVVNEDNKP